MTEQGNIKVFDNIDILNYMQIFFGHQYIYEINGDKTDIYISDGKKSIGIYCENGKIIEIRDLIEIKWESQS